MVLLLVAGSALYLLGILTGVGILIAWALWASIGHAEDEVPRK